MLDKSFLHFLCVFLLLLLRTFVHRRNRLLGSLTWLLPRVERHRFCGTSLTVLFCWTRSIWLKSLLDSFRRILQHRICSNGSWFFLDSKHRVLLKFCFQSSTVLEQVEFLNTVLRNEPLLGLAERLYHRIGGLLHGCESASACVVLGRRMVPGVSVCVYNPAGEADLGVHLGDDGLSFWLLQELENLHLLLESF